jgi:arylsulfatase A-like enzyme
VLTGLILGLASLITFGAEMLCRLPLGRYVCLKVAEQCLRPFRASQGCCGWAWAFATRYKWMKQIPSFFGGTRNGMVVSWPARITDNGNSTMW